MINNIQKLKDEWFLENAPLGEALGYPECCIKEFSDQPPALLNSKKKPSKNDLRRYKSACINGQFTGFIPCEFHAKEIVSGKISLVSLIKDRDKHFPPFPYYGI